MKRRDGWQPSGIFTIRVPRSVHENLRALAEEEGVSFNSTVVALLAEAIGRRGVETKLAPAIDGWQFSSVDSPLPHLSVRA